MKPTMRTRDILESTGASILELPQDPRQILADALLAASQPIRLFRSSSVLWNPPTAGFRIWIPDRDKDNAPIDTTDLRWNIKCRLCRITGGTTGFVVDGAWSPQPNALPHTEPGNLIDCYVPVPLHPGAIDELVRCLEDVVLQGRQHFAACAINDSWFYSFPAEALARATAVDSHDGVGNGDAHALSGSRES